VAVDAQPSARDLVALWERARGLPELDRALVLWAASSGASPEELGDRPVGARDAALLELRSQLYGAKAPCHVACPACGESLEFDIDLRELARGAPAEVEWSLSIGDFTLRLRLPTSNDLRAVARAGDLAAAQAALLGRCVLAAERLGDRVAVDKLPAEVCAKVDAALAERDPQAELSFAVACLPCGHRWTSIFDVASYLWRELDVDARRLLAQVDVLARVYGWTEDTILGLSRTRRQLYVEMVVSR
jgi:hypothetical protein